MPWHNCWHCTSVKSDNILIYPKQCQTFLHLHALRMAWIWRLMLMAPGEDFLDVIAKVLSPTDNIDYKLLLWHPDIPGSLALYQEVAKTFFLGSVNCLDFIIITFLSSLINKINSPYYVTLNLNLKSLPAIPYPCSHYFRASGTLACRPENQYIDRVTRAFVPT